MPLNMPTGSSSLTSKRAVGNNPNRVASPRPGGNRRLPNVQGFTYESKERYPEYPVRVWFKSKLNVLYNDDWWSWSTGAGM